MRCSPHLEMEAGTNDVTELSGTDRENIRKQTLSTVARGKQTLSSGRHFQPTSHSPIHAHIQTLPRYRPPLRRAKQFPPDPTEQHSRSNHPDSHDEGLVPYRVQSLLLYIGLVDFVIGGGILHNRFGGFGSGATCSALLLVLQDGQQAVWITETWNTKLHG